MPNKQDRDIDFSKCFSEMSVELSEVSKRQIIIKNKERHPNLSKYAIAKYVKELGIGQTTVYDVLKRFEDSGSFKRRIGSGHVSEKMKKSDRNKLVKDALS